MKTKTIIVLIFLFCALRPAASADKMMIAVLDFEARGVSKSIAANVSDLIRNEMINSGRYVVIERSQMGAILKEQGLQVTGCTDISCAVQIGKILSARKILLGTVMKMGKKIVINGRIVDVELAVAEYSESATAESEEALIDSVKEFTENLTSKIGSSDTDKKYAELEKKRKEKEKAKKEEIEKKSEPEIPFPANPYKWQTAASLAATAVFFGGGIYMNMKIADANDEISDLEKKYDAAVSTSDARRLHSDIEDKQDSAKSYSLYRNIFYGAGAAALVATGYFAIRYVLLVRESRKTAVNFNEPVVVPVCWYSPKNKDSSANVFYLGAGLTARF